MPGRYTVKVKTRERSGRSKALRGLGQAEPVMGGGTARCVVGAAVLRVHHHSQFYSWFLIRMQHCAN